MQDAKQISVRNRFPTLDMIGVAVEHLPCYTRNAVSGPPLHGHDMVEMVFVLEGKGIHRVAGENLPLSSGALGIVHYDERHLVTGHNLNLINIYLDTQHHPAPVLPAPLCDLLPRVLPLHAQLRHKRNRAVHIQFPAGPRQAVCETLLGLVREQEECRPGYPEAMRLHYEFFLIHCARQLAEGDGMAARQTPPAAGDQRLEQLRQHIDQTFDEPLALAALAEHCGMARTYLCRAFKRHTGVTVFAYILQRRVERAMLLLATTSDKVIAIAYACGFRDLSHFNRVFKRVTGVTPTAYRRCMGPHIS